MADTSNQKDALFVNLVLMFQAAAMQQMGKVANPVTGKIEKNLDQARFSIDMIEMLKSKTAGNISSELEKLLDSTLTNLRLNYVDETEKAAKEEAESEKAEPSEEAVGKEARGGKAEAGENEAEAGGEAAEASDSGGEKAGGASGQDGESGAGTQRESGIAREGGDTDGS